MNVSNVNEVLIKGVEKGMNLTLFSELTCAHSITDVEKYSSIIDLLRLINIHYLEKYKIPCFCILMIVA